MSQHHPQKNFSFAWYNRVGGALAICGLSLVAAYLIGSRAIFTGSLQQYALALIALGVAVNRCAAILQRRRQA